MEVDVEIVRTEPIPTKSHSTLYRSTLFSLNRYLVNGIFSCAHFLKLLDSDKVPIEVIFDLLVVGKNSYIENVSHFASFAKVKKDMIFLGYPSNVLMELWGGNFFKNNPPRILVLVFVVSAWL